MASAITIDAVVLAGGQGSRLGHLDKGWVELAGQPLVQWCLAALRRQTLPPAQIFLSANRNLPAYRALGLPVLTDRYPDYPGPLAGIEAARQASHADWLLCAPCDTPMLPVDLAERLLSAALQHGATLAYASSQGQGHHAVCLVHRSELAELQRRLLHGELRLAGWQGDRQAVNAPFSESAAFLNLNSPADLATLAARLDPTS